MMIDTKRLRADFGALARECRALKNALRTTWTRPMADEQRRLTRLKWRVTELCVLRAWSRKRIHVRSIPNVDDVAAWHATIAERAAKDYALATDASNALGGAR